MNCKHMTCHQCPDPSRALREEVEQLREIVKTAGDRLRACAHQLTEHAYQEMADALFDLPASAEVALKADDR